MYMSEGVGNKSQGAFRALSCGYTHWASGQVTIFVIHNTVNNCIVNEARVLSSILAPSKGRRTCSNSDSDM